MDFIISLKYVLTARGTGTMKALLDNWDDEQIFIVSDENNTGA